jgi:hypothetical protein
MMGDLRLGFEGMGLHSRHWHGAGAAASALIESQKLKMHYGPDIAASNISPQQAAAHHAYYGARIELLKQGFLAGGSLHVYDIASAYPAAMVEFPSLASGEWVQKQGKDLPVRSISELRAMLEPASCVSMFKIRFQFPTYERYHPDARKAVFIPFYPVPYRDKRGGILFPSSGYGWYMRDDVLAAIAWLERFVPDFPRQTDKHHRMTAFEVEEAWIFQPAHGWSCGSSCPEKLHTFRTKFCLASGPILAGNKLITQSISAESCWACGDASASWRPSFTRKVSLPMSSCWLKRLSSSSNPEAVQSDSSDSMD